MRPTSGLPEPEQHDQVRQREQHRARVHTHRREILAEHDFEIGSRQCEEQLFGSLLALVGPHTHGDGGHEEEQQVREDVVELLQVGQVVQEETVLPERGRGGEKDEQRDEDVAGRIREIQAQIAAHDRAHHRPIHVELLHARPPARAARFVGAGQPVEVLFQRTTFTQRRRCAIQHQASVVHENHAIRHRFHFLQDVRRDENGLGASQDANVVAEIVNLVGIETRGGLVHDENGRIVQQRLSETHALAITARELADRLFRHAVERALCDHRVHAVLERGAQFARFAEEAQELDRRHVIIKRTVLGQVPQMTRAFQALRGHVETGDARRALAGGQIAGQDLHGRRLAGAVGAQERDDLTFGN
jgi:hypothetical protein